MCELAVTLQPRERLQGWFRRTSLRWVAFLFVYTQLTAKCWSSWSVLTTQLDIDLTLLLLALDNQCRTPHLQPCKDGHCISMYFFCNGENDCGDWSDELNCTAPVSIMTVVESRVIFHLPLCLRWTPILTHAPETLFSVVGWWNTNAFHLTGSAMEWMTVKMAEMKLTAPWNK